MSRLGKLIRNESKEIDVCGENFTFNSLGGTYWDIIRDVMSTIQKFTDKQDIENLNVDALYKCIYESMRISDKTITIDEVKGAISPLSSIEYTMTILKLSGVVPNDNSAE